MIKRCKTDPIVVKTLTKALKQSEASLATTDVDDGKLCSYN
jgi:23S rRNA A1618 N6-methylase RlmF